MTGDELLRQVADLINEHLHDVPLDDPFRGSLYAMALAGGATKPQTLKAVK